MIKILIAPDSFKGSLSSLQVIDIVERAARRVFPCVSTEGMPLSDGGEGLVKTLAKEFGHAEVTGPLGEKVNAEYGILGEKQAVMEMAQASGLPLVGENKDPLRATSFGTGELLKRLLERGYREIVVGLGGSATNDCGLGAMRALGVRFLDQAGNPVADDPSKMGEIGSFDAAGLPPALKEAKITAVCDVTNPLTGERGATAVYGPQKGVGPENRGILEKGIENVAEVIKRQTGIDAAHEKGFGAAGGLSAAMKVFLGAELKPGIDAVLDMLGFAERVKGADIVVTGEGRIDQQSVEYGKVIGGVKAACERAGVPCLALCGSMGGGVEAFFRGDPRSSIMTAVAGPASVGEALAHAEEWLENAAERAFRMIYTGMEIRK